MDKIYLDGSVHEGGGQILRTALAFSLITNKPFEICNIRSGRPVPGLKHQHLNCLKALRQISNFIVEGDFLGSETLTFIPGKIFSGNINVDIGTAGSITLLLQSVLIPAIFADKPLTITLLGGTDTKFSQPYDYFANVFLPNIQKFAKIDSKLIRRGYFPKGNGSVQIRISQRYKLYGSSTFDHFRKLLSFNIQPITIMGRGSLVQIKGRSHASSDLYDVNVAERQAGSAKRVLLKLDSPVSIDCAYQKTESTGSGIVLWAVFASEHDHDVFEQVRIGSDSLGEKGKPAEKVGKEAAENLIAQISLGNPVDSYLVDQLLPFIALVKGSSIKVNEITPHCLANIYVIEKFLGKTFDIDKKNNVIKTL